MENFLITAYGRSGTKFLSTIMNLSNKWTVLHEPRGDFDLKSYQKNNTVLPDKIIQDFERNFYGEVNSMMRFFFPMMNVKKEGIIIRDHKDILLSVANRRDDSKKEPYYLNKELRMLDNYLKEDKEIKKIYFSLMITDANYLESLLGHFCIFDVDVKPGMLSEKINPNRTAKFNSFEELPEEVIREYEKFNWKFEFLI